MQTNSFCLTALISQMEKFWLYGLQVNEIALLYNQLQEPPCVVVKLLAMLTRDCRLDPWLHQSFR